MKLVLKVILERNNTKIEREIKSSQTGFRPKKGTREGIFNLRVIMEKYLGANKPIFICFIDYEKAFDRVFHSEIMNCLDKIDMDSKDRRLIQNLYWKQSAVIQQEDGHSKPIPIKRGVRQGCVISPALFNLYTQEIFNDSDHLPGCKIGGININNLRYADDTALLAETEEDLQKIVDEVAKNSENKGLKMNVKKDKKC
jgi:retron-type reverse transcriptase